MAGSKTGATAEAAKLIRADIKAALKSGALGSYPESISFGVRTRTASLMTAIDITIKGASGDWALISFEEYGVTRYRLSADCLKLGRTLREIGTRHFQENGQSSFLDVQLENGTQIPR